MRSGSCECRVWCAAALVHGGHRVCHPLPRRHLRDADHIETRRSRSDAPRPCVRTRRAKPVASDLLLRIHDARTLDGCAFFDAFTRLASPHPPGTGNDGRQKSGTSGLAMDRRLRAAGAYRVRPRRTWSDHASDGYLHPNAVAASAKRDVTRAGAYSALRMACRVESGSSLGHDASRRACACLRRGDLSPALSHRIRL